MSEKDFKNKENNTSLNAEVVDEKNNNQVMPKEESNNSEKKKNKGVADVIFGCLKTLGRWFARLFYGPSKMLVEDYSEKQKNEDKEPIISPIKQMVNGFFSKPRAVVALVLLVGMFLLVFIGPLFNPLDISYIEPAQQNVKPGYIMMKVPRDLSSNVKQISSYSRFSVGLSNDGDVFVWGDTTALNYDISKIPQEVHNEKILHVSAGFDHAIAIGESGAVYGWGQNMLGQYGEAPSDGASAILYTWAPKTILDGFKNVDDIKEVVCGYQVNAIVMQNGSYYFWGNNNSGAINIVKFKSQVRNKADMGIGVDKIRFTSTNIVALMSDGSVVTASEGLRYIRNEAGELVDLDKFLTDNNIVIKDIATTNSTLAMVTDEGKILVVGSITNKEDVIPVIEEGDKVVSIEGGSRHYTALTESGKVYSWGSNEWKQSSAPNTDNVSKIFVGPFQNYAVNEESKLVEKWGLKGYLMGTDSFGRCVWNRILNGGRMTMTIGAIAVIISSIIGIIIGCLSGYFGGWVDMVLMRITEIVSAIPFLPFAMILSVIVQLAGLGETMRIVMMMVILGLLSWTGLARLVRGQVLAEREKEFVTAAKAMGVKEIKIAFKHILPNIISIIIVSMTLDFAGCMLTESSLSYLGFGVRGNPTWGNMLTNANNSIIIQNYYWQWLFPSIFLAITTICINMIGDALRDVMDPKSILEK